ncbi:MAG: hypothetical protein GPJ27_14675 [Microcystis aeruginosa L111-01]|uniref:Uncharacterized protein n=1 Tax=Microcystis aeruginosa G11-04 TaxID=2685956 RepID=A0A966FZK0_MICAE|nr:hypothetical protein [Microcystis aeruginosa W13-15]NCR23079.1 hypothetical protein [Microcystis aeruginosa L111-01]NCR26742.1 hypothetical protein [Microcystis aeruginosa LE13-04]NCS39368.1 hypothetical protein [Microcystis aeruginosa BS13-10]NCS57227.1 hypothetical protein [Microcystis aeruginosa G11-04]NCT43173.1 hypothetical protein [Microcystis aeruginosa G11-09]TRU64996.1 MAG: hypothetical protein EWV90_05615 [Microcystis aeruginosa Ma_QC_Ch_20071001_M135]
MTIATSGNHGVIPFFFIRVTTNAGLASIRAWMSVMDLEIWYESREKKIGANSKNSHMGFGKRLKSVDE